jgi:hypothetical protein
LTKRRKKPELSAGKANVTAITLQGSAVSSPPPSLGFEIGYRIRSKKRNVHGSKSVGERREETAD